MATTARIDVKDQGPLGAIRELGHHMLESGDIQALLVAKRLPRQGSVMPALISDPAELEEADPLSPAFPLNAAKLVSRLTKGETRGRIGAILRPCEIRAVVELVKLNQGSMQEVLLLSLDCLRALPNNEYSALVRQEGTAALTERYLKAVQEGHETVTATFPLAPACAICEHPVAEAADLHIGLAGVDLSKHLLLQANTARGEGLLTRLGYQDCPEPPAHRQALEGLRSSKKTARDACFAATQEATTDLDKLSEYLAGCVNCYNCRVACPVCYCKECVFVTDVFDHRPTQYLGWANRQGSLKLPTDTVFFHLTRLAHMSLSCVGCGQCSNACPNNIPIMELFRTVAQNTQNAFGYVPGRNPDEPIPLSVFSEEEFEEVVDHLA